MLIAAVGLALGGLVIPCVAQLSSDDIDGLRQRGTEEGWTFTVGDNPATRRPLEQLCGLVEPPNWWEGATFDPCTPRGELPSYWDWRWGGCTPIRDQGACGSCWAFGSIGAMESAIRIETGVSVDLSEQWLVSCTESGGCGGGWHASANEYLRCGSLQDPCGEGGAVLEADFPYVAMDDPCECPYPHPHCLHHWAYVGSGPQIPSVEQIKQAILDHGPVVTCVHVNAAFQAYTGGVFQGCADGSTNHCVVLVGWNDSQGDEGCWILRNSWGTGWGGSGYMRIEYGCSRIGYATCYVDYVPPAGDCNGNGIPDVQDLAEGTSPDCNGNAIPDECDVADGRSADCNGNGLPDECEIADFSAEDCNANGVPDECENESLSGFIGAYFDGADFTGDLRGRIDETINFNWGPGAPWAAFGCDTFSVRWSGYVRTPDIAGEYTFQTRTDDGVRLWVNNQLLIDRWIDQSAENWSGTIALPAEAVCPLVMEYYDNTGNARARLRWQPPGGTMVTIPADHLTPARDCNMNGVLDDCDLAAGTSFDIDGNGVPDECDPLRGDLNCDGLINDADIAVFVTALGGPLAYLSDQANCDWLSADCDWDGDVDFDDINPFVALLGR